MALSHYRQNFHHKSMWTPVLAAPIFSLTAVWLVFDRSHLLLLGFAGLMWLGVMIGAAGFYYHFHASASVSAAIRCATFWLGLRSFCRFSLAR